MNVRKDEFQIDESQSLIDFLINNLSFINSEQDCNKLISEKRILVNEKIISENINLVEKDVVCILTPQEFEPKINSDFEIIYQDEFLFAVNKPAPLPVHPAGKYYFNTLTNLLKEKIYVENLDIKEFYPVNRLDRETTGIVLFAKTKEIAAKLGNLFERKEINKKYVAVCFGKIIEKHFVIDKPLLKTNFEEFRNHVVVDEKGKPSTTIVNLIKSNNKFSLVEINLLTGRSHQIRVHLASVGFPIVGDKEYGKYPYIFIKFNKNEISENEIVEKLLTRHQLLHCEEISFVHPISNKKLIICAKMPEDMKIFINENF